jgi:hypothetical protein
MSYFEKMVSDDANRCGSPVHNRRLQMSPARAATLAAMMRNSNRRKYMRSTNPIPFDVITDPEKDGAEIILRVKNDGLDLPTTETSE